MATMRFRSTAVLALALALLTCSASLSEDAIQFEFGRDHRANPRLPEDVPDALIGFMRAHGLLAR